MHILDFQNKCWLDNLTVEGQSPEARMGHSALLYEDSVLIYGGCNGNKVLNDTFNLNLAQIHEKKVQ